MTNTSNFTNIRIHILFAPVIRRQGKSIWNMLVEKQELKSLKNLDEILKKFPSSQTWKPLQTGFLDNY